MIDEIARTGEATRVVLPASCTLNEAAEVRNLLLVGLDAPGPVEIDAGAVQRIDTSVMQLLACLVHDLRQARRDVRWTETSAEFDRAVRQLGMGRLLGRAG